MPEKNKKLRSEFSVIIRGENLEMEAIEKALELKATQTVRRGEVLNELPRVIASSDVWACTLPLTEPHGEDEAFQQLLESLERHKEALNRIAAVHQITFRLCVQSYSAQIAYRLMPSTLDRLSALGCPLDVTSLSLGALDFR